MLTNTTAIVISLGLSLLFVLWPELDLWVTELFYDTELQSFDWNQNPAIQGIYWLFKHLPKLLVPLMVIFLLLCRHYAWFKRNKTLTQFALIALLLGPGIIVHYGFKDQWDRARPRQIEQFSGDKTFTPAWVVSDQCENNCSFVSGHAAMGFYFMILGWLLTSRKAFYLGITMGLIAGFGRVAQGGHFISDVLLAGVIVYWSIWATALFFNDLNGSNIKRTQ